MATSVIWWHERWEWSAGYRSDCNGYEKYFPHLRHFPFSSIEILFFLVILFALEYVLNFVWGSIIGPWNPSQCTCVHVYSSCTGGGVCDRTCAWSLTARYVGLQHVFAYVRKQTRNSFVLQPNVVFILLRLIHIFSEMVFSTAWACWCGIH